MGNPLKPFSLVQNRRLPCVVLTQIGNRSGQLLPKRANVKKTSKGSMKSDLYNLPIIQGVDYRNRQVKQSPNKPKPSKILTNKYESTNPCKAV